MADRTDWPALRQTVQAYLHSPHNALPWRYVTPRARLYPSPNATNETRALMLLLARDYAGVDARVSCHAQ